MDVTKIKRMIGQCSQVSRLIAEVESQFHFNTAELRDKEDGV